MLSLMTIYCGSAVTGACRFTLLFFSRLRSTYIPSIRYIYVWCKKIQKRVSRDISVHSYKGFDYYERMWVCVCICFLLFIFCQSNHQAMLTVGDFGRRICACTPRVPDKSIKLTIHMATSTDIWTDKRWRYDIGFE